MAEIAKVKMDGIGITDEYLFDKLKDVIDNAWMSDIEGNPIPDYKTRLKAIELALKLKGYLGKQKLIQIANIFSQSLNNHE